MIKYQNYNHYKVPITINPLDYGKLIYKNNNTYIISITSKTLAIITQFEEFNEVKFFRDGDFAFTFKDHIINNETFVRSIDNRKFTFKNNELISINTNKIIIQ
jgi:hypothetical protein